MGTICHVWCLIVFEHSGLKITSMHKTKNGMIEPTCSRLHRMKQHGLMPKYIRLDNAGENVKLKERAESRDWKLGLEWEFTAEGTPQQNSLAEVGIAYIMNGAKSMTEAAHVPDEFMHTLLPKAIETKTKLDGLTVVKRGGLDKTRYEHSVGENPPFTDHLRTWGEAGTVTIKRKIKGKFQKKGIVCMMVGHPIDHPADCHEMWDVNTKGIHKTRDITWLHRMFFNTAGNTNIQIEEGDDDDDSNLHW